MKTINCKTKNPSSVKRQQQTHNRPHTWYICVTHPALPTFCKRRYVLCLGGRFTFACIHESAVHIYIQSLEMLSQQSPELENQWLSWLILEISQCLNYTRFNTDLHLALRTRAWCEGVSTNVFSRYASWKPMEICGIIRQTGGWNVHWSRTNKSQPHHPVVRSPRRWCKLPMWLPQRDNLVWRATVQSEKTLKVPYMDLL